jgi:hypothetical protein
LTPNIRDPNQRPDDKVWQPPYLLTGRGCDDLHGSAGPAMAHDLHDDASGARRLPDDLSTSGAAGLDNPPPRAGARRAGGSQLRRTWVRDLSQRREAAPKARRGWYAYQVVGAATVPSWAVEVALTIERPLDLRPGELASDSEEAVRPWPASEGPEGSRPAAAQSPSPESGRPGGQADPPPQPAPDPLRERARVQAMVLLRAPGRANWLAGIAEVAAEVEAAAGVRLVNDAGTGVESVMGARSRLLMGPPLPGMEPIPPAVATAQLGAAGARGLPAPLRRWRPAAGAAHLSWQASVGSVVICDGPCGVSAQAVVVLRGKGQTGAIAPPPGGALVLRAWRARRTWGVACGLVVGAAQALGLGREAGHVAASARAAGWDAAVLQGLPALHLARAGDHRQVAPEAAALAASGAQVAALYETFLTAGGLGRPVGSAALSRALAVTP